MEDKIEIGEYVRTKDGIIYKIENGEEFYEDSVDVGIGIIPDVDGIWIDRECLDYIDKKDIVKHSKQLIDLIGCGDIVNRHLVIDKYEDVDEYGNDFWCLIIEDVSLLNKTIREEDIQTILTKEQFDVNCYKVGGEE